MAPCGWYASPRPPGRLAKHAARVADSGANLPPRDAPQLLLCRDSRGGYLGSDTGHFGSIADGEAYTVERWPSVDVFFFFAHRVVAGPPAEWIAAAHRHGVPCIGTFIVEHSAEVLWPLLSGALPPVAVAEQLARLAAHYGFDGWLLNIEGQRRPAATVPVVLEWTAAVTPSCTQLTVSPAVVL
jgi:mannosyl-glycoprotein endo-beta-N-acetylglucosaminidase